ncbi:NUDIX hydrolase [Lacihabitans sp. LS3-19]|uniref:NUDIX hydrolase n=1 Tax=Lacihabitans sp. LS3-19 TaxID=2487335 RepID=UPI0020CC8DA1|nr:NUDIX domain-containing protein [Lacihabitans sp. LS3-19]MCP9770502.1 NUDIX hydrolase [Lacihabitans sp. LS3-19]
MNSFNSKNYLQQLSIDCVIFGYKEAELKVLIPKILLKKPLYSLPGGFIYLDESIDNAAMRILEERTGINDIYLEQYHVFGKENRINKDLLDNMEEFSKQMNQIELEENGINWLSNRFVSIGYYALVDINKVNPKIGKMDESVEWYNVKSLPQLIMDHGEMVEKALETLRRNLDEKLIGFNLLPETFTMREVQELYEAVYDKPFARNNFQKKILDLNVLERLEKKFTGAANKAPYLYRFLM